MLRVVPLNLIFLGCPQVLLRRYFFFMIQDISRENVKELFLTAHTKCQGSQWISAGSPRLITPLRKPGLKEQGPHARGMAIA